MNISGVLIHAYPEKAEVVREQLVKLPGVEVHAISPEGRIVATIEAEGANRMADTLVLCQNTRGVLSASVIYHHDENIEDEDTIDDLSGSNIETEQCQDWNVQEASK